MNPPAPPTQYLDFPRQWLSETKPWTQVRGGGRLDQNTVSLELRMVQRPSKELYSVLPVQREQSNRDLGEPNPRPLPKES